MKIAGIIAEYNPFHSGHALHIEKTREKCGEDTAVVCVMSGSFVQRGEPA
ncbi:MAG: nucleotidyltransferase family protein, partial [Oscillospiraceae bacterium]|nr:nucleotidyltransferase family protein [Oscillospiraceae bacterium]